MNEFREIHGASPAEMDRLWEEGWRHFGTQFFRYDMSWHQDRPARVLPLRVCLPKFIASRSQMRILKRHEDVRVGFGPAVIDAEREKMFDKHKARFTENVPDSLYDFFSSEPACVPCKTIECRLLVGDRLIAVGYLDVGTAAVSAVYAMFDPTESRRSPGIRLILEEIHWARERGFRYAYLGYCFDEASFYDYKKRFRGSEYLDWKTMRHLPFDGAVPTR
jgi:arginine-tRNA-protein transferase